MIEKHITEAIRQLRKGEKIGRRGTPVISFWDMRPKWEKYGTAWAYVGSDGDLQNNGRTFTVPALIQLVYLRTHDGKVCQLAYVIQEEVSGPPGDMAAYRAQMEFERLTARFPQTIT